MTLAKAIEILELNVRQRNTRMPPDVLDALKLGIEALRRILKERTMGAGADWGHLPGETEEVETP